MASKQKLIKALSSGLGINQESIELAEVGGGFTGASKFILNTNGTKYFIKTAEKTEKTDAFLIMSESQIYDLLGKLGLSGKIFPKYENFVNDEQVRALILEYLDADWGGPWNIKNIKLVDRALRALHNTPLSDKDKELLGSISASVSEFVGEAAKRKMSDEEKIKQFRESLNASKKGFESWDGQIYYKCSDELVEMVIAEASKKNEDKPQALIMHDMNFANIGFSGSHAYFVDPVFMRLGDPEHDRSVLGINILYRTKGKIAPKTKKFVIDNFLRSKPILARLIGYHTVTAKESEEASSSDWQKYHQGCAKAGLEVFSSQ